MKWNEFKTFIKEMRKRQCTLLKQQGGGNDVMLSISVVHHGIDDTVTFMPHGLDLRTGLAFSYAAGRYKYINIKSLLEFKG